jgi:serine/threonine protein phosphatase PrpC
VLPPLGDAASSSWRLEGGSTGWCTVRAASVVGVRHRLAGQPSQDWFAWSHGRAGLTVAVADGVGSLDGSGAAARRAAVAAASAGAAFGGAASASTPGSTEPLREAVEAANRAVRYQDESELPDGGDAGATTLVVAAVTPTGEVRLARVGDTTAFHLSPDGGWQELFPAPEPEQVGTETDALPTDSLQPAWADAVLRPGEVLMIASDGLADPWRDGPATVSPALVSSLLGRPSPLELGRLVDFSRQGCHDDRTAVCIWLDQSTGT